jgi:hypothetical protein
MDESQRGVTLTSDEREVLSTVRDIYASHDDDDSCSRIAAVIDGLLDRTKREHAGSAARDR